MVIGLGVRGGVKTCTPFASVTFVRGLEEKVTPWGPNLIARRDNAGKAPQAAPPRRLRGETNQWRGLSVFKRNQAWSKWSSLKTPFRLQHTASSSSLSRLSHPNASRRRRLFSPCGIRFPFFLGPGGKFDVSAVGVRGILDMATWTTPGPRLDQPPRFLDHSGFSRSIGRFRAGRSRTPFPSKREPPPGRPLLAKTPRRRSNPLLGLVGPRVVQKWSTPSWTNLGLVRLNVSRYASTKRCAWCCGIGSGRG